MEGMQHQNNKVEFLQLQARKVAKVTGIIATCVIFYSILHAIALSSLKDDLEGQIQEFYSNTPEHPRHGPIVTSVDQRKFELA
jgi:hypothetical protein